jgi:hypothetical protein
VRPYLVGAAAALVAFAFWQSHRADRCERRPRTLSKVLLWSSALFVAAMLLAPDIVANLLAG